MARTRWPPGPVNPGLLPRPGRSDRQRRWVPRTGARPTDRYQDNPSGVGRFAGQAGTRSPTLRPHHRKTAEAGPGALTHILPADYEREANSLECRVGAHRSPILVRRHRSPCGWIAILEVLPGGLRPGLLWVGGHRGAACGSRNFERQSTPVAVPARPAVPAARNAAPGPAPWMITPPNALPLASPTVMTANVQVKASVAVAGGTARWIEALSDPSHGDSGRPRGIMSSARTARLGAAASSMSAAANNARHPIARRSTGARQLLLP